MTGDALRGDEQHQTGEPHQHAQCRLTARPVARQPPVHDHPQGHAATSSAATPEGAPWCSPSDTRPLPSAGRSSPRAAQPRSSRGVARSPRVRCEGQDGAEKQAGHEVAPARRRHRRQVLDHDTDREVGRAPHDVHDAERGPDEPARRARRDDRRRKGQRGGLLLHPVMLRSTGGGPRHASRSFDDFPASTSPPLRESASVGHSKASISMFCRRTSRSCELPDMTSSRRLVGAGAHAVEVTVPTLMSTPGVELVAICSRGTSARELAETWSVEGVAAEVEEFLKVGEFDAAVLASSHLPTRRRSLSRRGRRARLRRDATGVQRGCHPALRPGQRRPPEAADVVRRLQRQVRRHVAAGPRARRRAWPDHPRGDGLHADQPRGGLWERISSTACCSPSVSSRSR